MNTLETSGRIIVGIAILALGAFCFVYANFIPGRPPGWGEPWAGFALLGFILGGLVVIASALILVDKMTAASAIFIAAVVMLFSFGKHLPVFMNDWPNAYKTLALSGGMLVLAGSSLLREPGFIGGLTISRSAAQRMIFIGTLCMAAFFIASGYAHIKWANFVQTIIPAFYPYRLFLTYFTAVCLLAGGIGVVIPKTRYLAALLSGIMVLGWFLMLHVPRFVMDPANGSDQLSLFESLSVGGMFLVLAGIAKKG